VGNPLFKTSTSNKSAKPRKTAAPKQKKATATKKTAAPKKKKATATKKTAAPKKKKATATKKTMAQEEYAYGHSCPNLSHSRKYSIRKSPPYPANAPGCHNATRKGNDKCMYVSKAGKDGVFRWSKKAAKDTSSPKETMGTEPKTEKEYGKACPNLSHFRKYSSRKSPPYPANSPGCQGKTKKGNDKLMYISKPNKNGIYRWSKIK